MATVNVPKLFMPRQGPDLDTESDSQAVFNYVMAMQQALIEWVDALKRLNP